MLACEIKLSAMPKGLNGYNDGDDDADDCHDALHIRLGLSIGGTRPAGHGLLGAGQGLACATFDSL